MCYFPSMHRHRMEYGKSSVSKSWSLRVVRPEEVPETRWFHRWVLRRRTREVEVVMFAGPLPDGTTITRRLNGPCELYFEWEGPARITDYSFSLANIEAVDIDKLVIGDGRPYA